MDGALSRVASSSQEKKKDGASASSALILTVLGAVVGSENAAMFLCFIWEMRTQMRRSKASLGVRLAVHTVDVTGVSVIDVLIMKYFFETCITGGFHEGF